MNVKPASRQNPPSPITVVQRAEQAPAGANWLWLIFFGIVWLLFTLLIYLHDPKIGYALLPLVYFAGLLLAGAHTVQKIYKLHSYRQAFQYLFAAVFGVGYPSQEICDGKALVNPGSENIISRMGGKGWLIVQPGNAVLVEDLDGSIRVLGTGQHFLRRREIVKEIVSLEDRDMEVERMVATSKDGIGVEARKVHYRYRIYREAVSSQDKLHAYEDGFPFSEEAIRSMVYSRTANEKGVIPWQSAVNFPIDAVVTDYINQHWADELTAPSESAQDPREAIYKVVRGENMRKIMRDRGAELIWIDIGNLEVPETEVAAQRLNTWQAKWTGDASVVRAYGEAQRQAYQELGRAEAGAEVLMSMVHALEDVRSQGDSPKNMRAIFRARIAQLLDAMHDQKSTHPSPES